MCNENATKRENRRILIVGAGTHGKVTEEVARACGYSCISYLDDVDGGAIGTVEDAKSFLDEYDAAFVSIGDNQMRAELTSKLVELGYEIPVLIHPTAYVSVSAIIGSGSIIEPHASINANVIVGCGGIVSIGAVIDHNANIGEYCHIDAGGIVKAGERVPGYTKIQ